MIVGISALVLVVGLILLLSYTFFSLKEVELDYRTSHTNITATDEEIIESGQIKMGGTVFFRNKAKIEENIENEFPYLNVINIETVFPSKFVIHLAERQEVYAIQGNEEYYICDEEFRVLDIEKDLDQTRAILLTGDFSLERMDVGQYITSIDNSKIYQALYEKNLTLGNQKDLIEKITLCTIYDDGIKEDIDAVKVSLKGGQTLTLANPEENLSYKAHLFMQVYANLFDMIGKESLQADGSMALLTEENLKTCEIFINNYYTPSQNGGENCYFKIFVAN